MYKDERIKLQKLQNDLVMDTIHNLQQILHSLRCGSFQGMSLMSQLVEFQS